MTTHTQAGTMAGKAPAGPQSQQGKKQKNSVLKRVKKKFRVFSIRSGMDLPFFFLLLVHYIWEVLNDN